MQCISVKPGEKQHKENVHLTMKINERFKAKWNE